MIPTNLLTKERMSSAIAGGFYDDQVRPTIKIDRFEKTSQGWNVWGQVLDCTFIAYWDNKVAGIDGLNVDRKSDGERIVTIDEYDLHLPESDPALGCAIVDGLGRVIASIVG